MSRPTHLEFKFDTMRRLKEESSRNSNDCVQWFEVHVKKKKNIQVPASFYLLIKIYYFIL